MTVIDFLQTPLAQQTKFWLDEETHDVMTSCEVCGATARHTTEQAEDFRFEHSATCAVGLDAGRALRDEYAPGDAGQAQLVEKTAADPDQVLFVKRPLWDLLMESLRDHFDDRADYAVAAKSLAEGLRSGERPSDTELDALVAHLTDVIDAREPELAALEQLRESPRPAPVPEGLRLESAKGGAPVIASKQLWDNIAAVTEGTFDVADALAARLSELLAMAEAGERPDRQELAELADAIIETRNTLAEHREMFQRWMGDLAWVPTEV